MFEVGFTEIVLIFGIALLVLGPARLPKLAADIGRWAGRARSMARQLRTQLEQETQFDPLADPKPATSTAVEHDPRRRPTDESRAHAGPARHRRDRTRRVPLLPLDEPALLNPTPDAAASPAKTDADEPKPG